MAVDLPRLLVRAARVFAGVILGVFLGGGAGVLALVVYPRDLFPESSEGILQAVFGLYVLVGYTLAGVILGTVAALSRNRRCLVGFCVGAAVGWAGAVGMIATLPRVLEALKAAESGGDRLDRGMMTLGLSLVLLIAGAFIGRRRGSSSRAEPGSGAGSPGE